MRLFDFNEDYAIIPVPTTLAIKEFRDLYDRDETPGKRRAFLELTGCYYFGSMGSDNVYKAYKPQERVDRINSEIFTGSEPFDLGDPLIHAACEKIIELEDASLFKMYLRTSIKNIHKLKDFLENVDLDERDNNNKLIHDAVKYANNIQRVAELTKDLRELEIQVALDDEREAGRIRGGGSDEYDI